MRLEGTVNPGSYAGFELLLSPLPPIVQILGGFYLGLRLSGFTPS